MLNRVREQAAAMAARPIRVLEALGETSKAAENPVLKASFLARAPELAEDMARHMTALWESKSAQCVALPAGTISRPRKDVGERLCFRRHTPLPLGSHPLAVPDLSRASDSVSPGRQPNSSRMLAVLAWPGGSNS